MRTFIAVCGWRTGGMSIVAVEKTREAAEYALSKKQGEIDLKFIQVWEDGKQIDTLHLLRAGCKCGYCTLSR